MKKCVHCLLVNNTHTHLLGAKHLCIYFWNLDTVVVLLFNVRYSVFNVWMTRCFELCCGQFYCSYSSVFYLLLQWMKVILLQKPCWVISNPGKWVHALISYCVMIHRSVHGCGFASTLLACLSYSLTKERDSPLIWNCL